MEPDGIVDQAHESLGLQRFREIGDRAVCQALLAQRRLIVRGHDDDRHAGLCQRELALHLAAGEPAHLVVEDDATARR